MSEKTLTVENLSIIYHKLDRDKKNKINPLSNFNKYDVNRHNEHKYIVEDFSFHIDAGEIFGLVGKSGCGKTTVAWTVMGMIEQMGGHAAGKITLRDKVIFDDGYKDVEKVWWTDMSIVPQASMSSFNPSLTIGDTLAETMKAHKFQLDRIDEHSKEIMELVRLEEDVLSYYPHQMSGGMKQRAAIGVAMCLEPRLLILDEATTGLDVLVEADILKTIRTIQQQSGMSILMISHDRRLTGAMCDRILNMSEVSHG